MGVTGLVDRMEEKGLVVRRDDSKDRRVKRVYLSEATAEFIPLFTTLAGEIIDEFFEGIEENEVDVLIGLLLRVKQNAARILSEVDPHDPC